MRGLYLGVLIPSFLSFLLQSTAAFPRNITIDDTFGDQMTGLKPVYSPPTDGVWKNASCIGCAVVPSTEQALDGTWTAATYNPGLGTMSVDLQFTGTAIYVFFILANTVAEGITTLTQCNFTLDGQLVGAFQHIPTASFEFQYNALAYSNDSLPNKPHNLSIGTTGQGNVLVTFDYAMYTFDDALLANPTVASASASASTPTSTQNNPGSTSTPEPPAKRRVPVGEIAGGVIGGLALLVMLVIFLFFRRRKSQRTAKISGSGLLIDDSSQNQIAEQGISQPVSLASASSYGLNRSSIPLTTKTPPRSGPWYSGHTVNQPSYDLESSDGFVSRTNNALSHPPAIIRSKGEAKHVHKTLPSFLHDGIMIPTNNNAVASDPPIFPSALPGAGHAGSTQSPPQTKRSRHKVEMQRQIRQAELERQMEAIQQEMRALQTTTSSNAQSHSRDEVDVADMREQIRMMREHIDRLEGQQQSAWAQGLTDEPPPGYSSSSPTLTRSSTSRQRS